MDSEVIDIMPVRLSQLISSQRQPQDEEPPILQQQWKILSNQSLVIVFEIESAYDGQPEGIFGGQFHNKDIKVHAWSKFKGVDHYH